MSRAKIIDENKIEVPKKIIKNLNLKSGDRIVFEVVLGDTLLIRKSNKKNGEKDIDEDYLKAISKTLEEEWGSEYDEEDYKDLQ